MRKALKAGVLTDLSSQLHGHRKVVKSTLSALIRLQRLDKPSAASLDTAKHRVLRRADSGQTTAHLFHGCRLDLPRAMPTISPVNILRFLLVGLHASYALCVAGQSLAVM